MELVLSPGGFGPEGPADGGPFRNEDVREWSRVDRITGMLERARVETGRWRANTRDAAQSYGKMIDSRERNSADGSVVQKARRQVEIFQSQGTGGRSFQVVRASQWASSRATDVSIDVPLTKPTNGDYSAGALSADSPSPRLSLWRGGLSEAGSMTATSDLETLSCLCRRLHDEALTRSRKMWSPSPSPPPLLPAPTSTAAAPAPMTPAGESAASEAALPAERRSNSSEDLASLVAADHAFARDCRTRRSLQIPAGEEERPPRRARNEFVAERARKFEEAAAAKAAAAEATPKRSFISAKSFTSIADNDFVKNDPNHPSKIAQTLAKLNIQENAPNGQAVQVSSTRRANNKTVVHLRNASSPVEGEAPTRCINVTAIKVEKDGESTTAATENGHYGLPPPPAEPAARDEPAAKPVKKVEFCKTEIHFAADSGKVNIVETDGKPPPTNKFRRRRRNNSLAAAANANAQKSNMPLVHFGDTSYEKYIFGGQGKPPPDEKIANNNPLAEENSKNYLLSELERKDRWSSPIEKIREESPAAAPIKEAPIDPDRLAEHSKFKGAHTTTVNILSDEGNATVSKLNEGRRGIQLQFASRSLSPLGELGDDQQALVSRTTKITVHLGSVAAAPARILLGSCRPYAALESVRLVMRLNELAGARERGAGGALGRLITRLCAEGEAGERAEGLWALSLEDHGGTERKSELGMLTDKASNAYPPVSHLVHKEAEAVPADKQASVKNQIVSKDSDNNQVLLKIVTTHKPMLARVESDVRSSHSPLRSRSKSHAADELAQHLESGGIGPAPGLSSPVDLAKDDCDKELIGAAPVVRDVDDDEEVSPTYENIFDAVSEGSPVYENFQVAKGLLPIAPEPEVKVAARKRPDKPGSPVPFERSSRKAKRVVANGAPVAVDDEKPTARPPAKAERAKGPVTPQLSGAKAEKSPQRASANGPGVAEARRSSSKASSTGARSSGSRDGSARRYGKDGKAAREEQGGKLASKRKTGKLLEASGAQDAKGKAELAVEKNGTVRSKKPVEVVYQTAVYNMKNEKLSKPTKPKEIKGPRLINDLICGGSKIKRPSDGKKIVKTAILSQNTSKRKEIPTTVNR